MKNKRKNSKEEKVEQKDSSESRILRDVNPFNLTTEERTLIKRVFQPSLQDLSNEFEELAEETFSLIISPHFLKTIKREESRKEKQQAFFPLVVNQDDKVLFQFESEAMELDTKDFEAVQQLYERLMNQKLQFIIEQSANLIEIGQSVNEKLNNQRFDKVMGAIDSIRKAELESAKDYKITLQEHSEATLNASIEDLYRNIDNALIYFKGWHSRDELENDYSVKMINYRFNRLMNDYLFFTLAKTSLITLKEKQNVNRFSLFDLTKDLDIVDRQFKEFNMKDWLAPPSPATSWQHRLFKLLNENHKQVVIKYDLEEVVKHDDE